MEAILADELKSFGAKDIRQDYRGVHFKGDQKLLYTLNYNVRTALRFLEKISSFEVTDASSLYDNIYQISWDVWFGVDQTFCVDVVGTNPSLKNTQFTAVKIKDAIVDKFRATKGKRPSISTEQPGCRLHFHLYQNQGTIYRDSSDTSLHLRGYRRHLGKAPMSEVLAAGLIAMSQWDQKSALIDPMCGSGTLLIEACLAAMKYPSQYFRKDFGFFRWADFDPYLWEEVRALANERRQLNLSFPLYGFDLDPEMARKSKENIIAAHCYGDIKIKEANFFDLKKSVIPVSTMIFNPPYDDRIKINNPASFYRKLSEHIKKEWKETTVWILLPDTSESKSFAMKPEKKFKVMNGPTPCQFCKFTVY